MGAGKPGARATREIGRDEGVKAGGGHGKKRGVARVLGLDREEGVDASDLSNGFGKWGQAVFC